MIISLLYCCWDLRYITWVVQILKFCSGSSNGFLSVSLCKIRELRQNFRSKKRWFRRKNRKTLFLNFQLISSFHIPVFRNNFFILILISNLLFELTLNSCHEHAYNLRSSFRLYYLKLNRYCCWKNHMPSKNVY